jgi:hypothetical protein
MIDALGFRGIWGRDPRNPDVEVFNTLRAVRDAVAAECSHYSRSLSTPQYPEAYRRLLKRPEVTLRLLSDTLVVVASVSPRMDTPRNERKLEQMTGHDLERRYRIVEGYLRYVVCDLLCVAVKTAALAGKPLAYRGVVSLGHFALDGNFILGPAVDEAAGLMEIADASVVWIAPSARKVEPFEPRGQIWGGPMVSPGVVPLKDGRRLPAPLVNTFARCNDLDEALAMEHALLESMAASDSLDVAIKHRNTRAFYHTILGPPKRLARKARQRRTTR